MSTEQPDAAVPTQGADSPAKKVARRWRRQPSRRAYLQSAIALFLLCAIVRIALAGWHALWADELFSLAMATGHSLEHPADVADASQGDFVELTEATTPDFYARYLEHRHPPANIAAVVRAVYLSDTSPPAYYVGLHFWTLLAGTSDVSLRAFSLLWALAAFPLVWSLGRQLGGRASALATGCVYALAPICVFYSVEGRMYSMLWFWSVALLWLSLRLHRRPESRAATLAAWIAVSAAGFLTHYFFAFVWGASILWLLVHPGHLRRAWLGGGLILVIVLLVPWYLRVPESLRMWRVTGGWLEWEPRGYDFLTHSLLLPWSYLNPAGVWGLRMQWQWLAAVVFVALAIFSLRRVWWCAPQRQLLWLAVAAACIGPIAFDMWRGTYVIAVPRYAIAGMPAALVLLGIALGGLRARPRIAFTIAVILLSLLGVQRMFRNPGRASQPTDLALREVAERLQPGDLVLVHSIPSGVIGAARYLEQYRKPDQPPPAFAAWVGQLGRRQVPRDIVELTDGRKRVLFVWFHPVGEPAPELDWLIDHARLEEEIWHDGIGIYIFDLTSGPAN